MNDLTKNFSTKLEAIFLENNAKKFPKKIAVAVSGGADSLALTLMLDEFCRVKKIKIFALTVDHKMRRSSSQEALELQKILRAKKISHQILTIDQEKIPQKNIEAKLREARYELLCEFCVKNKIEFLFLGHQLEDVAENFLIRLFRGSGLDGLSSMEMLSERSKIKLVRPLLDYEKDQLKFFLKSKKVKWFEDETNQDEKFLRNKMRKFFESFPDKKLIQKRIKNSADEIAKMRDFFDEVMLNEAREILSLNQFGYFLVDVKKLQKTTEKIALKILALVAMEVSGKIYKPRLEKLKIFYDFLLQEKKNKSRNFYGCVVKKYDSKKIIIFCDGADLARQNPINFRTILKKIFNENSVGTN